MPRPQIVLAKPRERDLGALVALENSSFQHDRLSRRALRRFLGSASASLQVAWIDEFIVGYALVTFRRGTSLARLYSIAVSPDHRGLGIARLLLQWAEGEALERGAGVMRLEVHPDNRAAISLYEVNGYHKFAIYSDYYEDHSDALRMEKGLVPEICTMPSRVHFYEQTLDFTCGSASLLMAMHAIDPDVVMDRRAEIAIWREATTIFMTSGVGGCGPRGLALAAKSRGFDAEIFMSDDEPLFVDSVRNEDKKDLLRFLHEDFVERVDRAGIPVHYGPLSFDTLQQRFEDGHMALVMISQYRLHGDKAPHWVTIANFDERFVYVSDPDPDEDLESVSRTDYVSVPILRSEFEQMAKYGKTRLQAAVVIRKQ